MGARSVKKEHSDEKAHRSKQVTTPPQTQQMTEIETHLEAMRDGEARVKRIEALQAQIQAGTYQVDSRAIAAKIVHTSRVQRLLGISPDVVDEFHLPDE
jgi:flagellar biosynthesis anti-sigma factor FlgM